jgi:hypothetical protein
MYVQFSLQFCSKLRKNYVICTVHFPWVHKIVIRQIYTLYYLLFNTVYIKNSSTCFELCYSSSSGAQRFIIPATHVRYSLEYMLGRLNIVNYTEFADTENNVKTFLN